MTTRRTAKKKIRTLINGGTTPVVYTDDGRVLAAGERIEVETVDEAATRLIDLGYLVMENERDDAPVDQDEQANPGESLPESGS